MPNILSTAASTSLDNKMPASSPKTNAMPAIIRFSYKNKPAIVRLDSPETIYILSSLLRFLSI